MIKFQLYNNLCRITCDIKCYEVGVVEFVVVIITGLLLSTFVSIFSLSKLPVLSGGDKDKSWSAPPAKNLMHFFFRLEEKQNGTVGFKPCGARCNCLKLG